MQIMEGFKNAEVQNNLSVFVTVIISVFGYSHLRESVSNGIFFHSGLQTSMNSWHVLKMNLIYTFSLSLRY